MEKSIFKTRAKPNFSMSNSACTESYCFVLFFLSYVIDTLFLPKEDSFNQDFSVAVKETPLKSSGCQMLFEIALT